MKQIESGHIVIFTVDLAVNQPDYHLAGCADDRAVRCPPNTCPRLIARAQVQMAVKSVVHRVIVPVSDTISKLPLKSFA